MAEAAKVVTHLPRPRARTTVDRKPLLDALARIAPASIQTKGFPMLSRTVRITAREDGRLELQATTLDLELTTWIDAHAEEPFDVIVPRPYLSRLVKWAGDLITLEHAETGADTVVKFGRTRATLPGYAVEDWPRSKFDQARDLKADDDRTVTVTAKAVDAMHRLAKFASPDDARPILTALCLDENRVAATDSYRLGVVEVDCDFGARVLLPADSVRFMPSRLIEDETVDMEIGRGTIRWEADGLRVATRRIEGEYPNYKQLIRTPGTRGFKVKREELILAVRRAMAVVPVDDKATPLRLTPAEGTLTVSMRSNIGADPSIFGALEEEVDATVSDDCPAIALNPRYLLELLQSLIDEFVAFDLYDALRPAMVVGGDTTVLLMPVRIS